jgi:hypothetical protein
MGNTGLPGGRTSSGFGIRIRDPTGPAENRGCAESLLTGQIAGNGTGTIRKVAGEFWDFLGWKESNKYREGGYVPPA